MAKDEHTGDDAKSWRDDLKGWLHRGVAAAEDMVDERYRALGDRLGWNTPRSLLCFTGWNNGRVARFGCRVLASKPGGGPQADDRWWEDLANTYRRWNSKEVPGAAVTAHWAGQTATVMADDEGYAWFDMEVRDTLPPGGPGFWSQASLSVKGEDGQLVHGQCAIVTPPPGAAFGLISDVDDTVLHTGITNLMVAAKLTFLRNAHTRSPLAGAPALYRALTTGDAQATQPMQRPAFYVSSSAWNLFDLLRDFAELNGLPPGPMMLRDLGVDETKFIKSSGHGHKLVRARRIADDFPDLPLLLFGDSGQADAELYATLAAERPEQVKAILIRDVDPETATDRDAAVREHLSATQDVGVPAFLIRDSAEAADRLVELGLLSETQAAAVTSATEQDRNRPTVGEASAKGALSPGTAEQ